MSNFRPETILFGFGILESCLYFEGGRVRYSLDPVVHEQLGNVPAQPGVGRLDKDQHLGVDPEPGLGPVVGRRGRFHGFSVAQHPAVDERGRSGITVHKTASREREQKKMGEGGQIVSFWFEAR